MKTASKFLVFTSLLSLLFSLGCYSGDKTLVPKPDYVPTEVEESYKLKFEPKVDIVFVVDDSGSMTTHQRNLATNMGLFTGSMEKNKFLDYHIGVMSTTSPGGYYSSGVQTGIMQGQPQFVSRQTDRGLRKLQYNVEALGTSGSATEKMFDPLYMGLVKDREKLNPGFLRTEAFLVVILVTDAEDQSEKASAFKVYNELLRLKAGDEAKVLGYAALSDPSFFGDRCSKDGYRTDPVLNRKFMTYFSNASNSRVSDGLATSPGRRPQANATNIFSLCDVQYGQKLANIGKDIRYRVSQKIPLPKLPVRGTIKLKYGKQYVDKKWWKYDPTSQSLILDPDIELQEEDGAEFAVVMDQADPNDTIGVPIGEDPSFEVED